MCILDVLLINTCKKYFILKLFSILELFFVYFIFGGGDNPEVPKTMLLRKMQLARHIVRLERELFNFSL